MDKKEKILVVALFVTIIVLLVAMGVTIKSFDKYMEASEKLENTLAKELDELRSERENNIIDGNTIIENNSGNSEVTTLNLENKTYVVDLETISKAENEEEQELQEKMLSDLDIKFLENDKVSLYLGNGSNYKGEYKITNNEVTLTMTEYESEAGGYFELITEPAEIILEVENENILVVKSKTEKAKIKEVKESRGDLAITEIDLNLYSTLDVGVKYKK